MGNASGCLKAAALGLVLTIGGCTVLFNRSCKGSDRSFSEDLGRKTVDVTVDTGKGAVDSAKEKLDKVDWGKAGQKTREAANKAIESGIKFMQGFEKPQPPKQKKPKSP